jgi:hypothetical protein
MAYIDYENIDIYNPDDQHKLARFIAPFTQQDSESCVQELVNFLKIEPRLPEQDKTYTKTEPIIIDPAGSREEVIDYLESIRDTNITADLAFYAYRDMTRCDWRPFMKAAVERCPVSIEKHADDGIDQVYSQLCAVRNESIYDGPRLAQPDEVANYSTGDGVEKAFTLANIILSRKPETELEVIIDDRDVIVKYQKEFSFASTKGLQKHLRIQSGNYEVLGE